VSKLLALAVAVTLSCLGLPVLVFAAVLGTPAVCATATPIPDPRSGPAEPDPAGDACTDAVLVMARADTWLTAFNGGPVPYLSSSDPTTWLDGYRRDCSGYASMALGLPGPGLTTADLAAQATPIDKTQLHAGDLLINPAPDLGGHVVIFDRWTDTAMTSYLGYEQAGDGGTHHRTIPYPYYGSYSMSPYRWIGRS
jgi:hypothetical protein